MNYSKYELTGFLSRSFANADDSDLLKMIDALPVKLSFTEGPWIAGGAVRRTLMGEAAAKSDLDLFFRSQVQLAEAAKALEDAGAKLKAKNAHNHEYEWAFDGAQQRVQLIAIGYFESAERVLDSFDFTICQFLTDGKTLLCGEYSLWDLARRRLVIHEITFATASMRRVLKYTSQGFKACTGFLGDFLQRVVAKPESVRADVGYID